MTLAELDTLRVDTMRALLTPEGQCEIWTYDVVSLMDATAMAHAEENFDNIIRHGHARRAGHRYALIGPGIDDQPFTTAIELFALIDWLCRDGALAAYYAPPDTRDLLAAARAAAEKETV